MKNKRKINKKRIFIFLLLIILIIFFIFKITTKQQSNDSNLINQGTNTSEPTEIAVQNKAPEVPEIQKINEQRKTCSEITTKRNLPVLMYHFFYDEQAGEIGADNNYIEIHDFEEQIKYLADNNYYVPTWSEVKDFVDGKIGLPEKSVIITVDDGNESFFRLAVPVLEKYNFYATSFLITSWYADCLDTYTSPVIDFQSHSHNMHIPGSDGKGAFLTLSYNDACSDLNTTRSIIGDNCIVFCYPFGHYNDNAKKTLKDCNYTLAFTTKYGRVSPGMDCYELPRIRMSKGDSLKSFISKVQ